MDRTAKKIIIVSDWKNGNKTCHVRSEREIIPGGFEVLPARVAKFTFSGYNPFPCYSMESTYESVSKWMYNNGWKATGNRITEIYYETIDTELANCFSVNHIQ